MNHYELIAVGLLALTTSCAAGGWQAKGGGYIYRTEIEQRSTGDSVNGTELGGRAEITYAGKSTNQHLATGVRVMAGSKQLDGLSSTGIRTEVEALDTYFEPLLRLYWLGPDTKVRPFIEGFAGYAHSSADFTQSNGFSGSETRDDLSWGAGIGIETSTDNITATFGLELRDGGTFTSRTFGEVDELEFGAYVLLGVKW